MATAQLGTLLRHIHRLAASDTIRKWTDRQLLDHFAGRRDEMAFSALVSRHGPRVMRVCRRVLNNEHDAEDAFQATFLVLARNTGSIRKRDTVADWLYGVAYRTAMKVKRTAARRRNHEARVKDNAPKTSPSPTWDDVRGVLDEELVRLPASFRTAFVLCVLEGKSSPEAAAELGVPEGTLKSRLNRARQRLQQRLAYRGIQLSALLAALSVAENVVSAAVPAVLTDVAIRSGLLVAAGKTAVEVIPAHVAALAAGVSRAMFLSKGKISVAVLLSAVLFAATSMVSNQVPAAIQPETPATQKAQTPVRKEGTAKPKEAAKDDVTFKGRVVDPQGKAIVEAKLLFLYPSADKVPEKVWAISDQDGRFSFMVPKSLESAPWSGSLWDDAYVVAAADGHGLGWVRVRPDSPDNVTVRLVKDDAPIQGRVLDLQGKPIAGVAVRVDWQLSAAGKGEPNEDLSGFLEKLKAGKRSAYSIEASSLVALWSPAFSALFPAVTTDKEGRFIIKGIGRERIAHLHVEGPTIATQKIKAMTRKGEMIRIPARPEDGEKAATYYGSSFDLIAMPTKPVEGVVTDKDTGKPLAGVIVRSSNIASVGDYNGICKTTTDKDGRYRLVGLPKGTGNAIAAEIKGPDDKRPYLPSYRDVSDTPGFEPAMIDLSLKRGVWVSGRVIDKATDKPVRAGITYYCFVDNPNSADIPHPAGVPSHFTQKDGSFRFVTVPGRGLIAVRANEDKYRMAVGVDKIKGERDESSGFITVPFILFPSNYHTIVEIAPKPDDQSITCDVIVDPGRALAGKIVGPDGKPVAATQISGLKPMTYWQHVPNQSTFEAIGFSTDEPRRIQVVNEEKKLAGWVLVRGDEKGPLEIKLQDWGTLTGRLLNPDGDPMTDVDIHPGGKSSEWGTFPGDPIKPDKDGRFRIEGLSPGLKYEVRVIKAPGYSLDIIDKTTKDLTIKAGETKDLGDIHVKPMD
jgi:RNA polymerase sigma factor (sigma-70 family)